MKTQQANPVESLYSSVCRPFSAFRPDKVGGFLKDVSWRVWGMKLQQADPRHASYLGPLSVGRRASLQSWA